MINFKHAASKNKLDNIYFYYEWIFLLCIWLQSTKICACIFIGKYTYTLIVKAFFYSTEDIFTNM